MNEKKKLLALLPTIRAAVDAWEDLPRELANSEELYHLGIYLEQLRSAHHEFTELQKYEESKL